MQRIWAPWRIEYVQSAGEGECPFCAAAEGRAPQWAVLVRCADAFVMLNAYPYNSGHVLVAPYRHVGRIQDLTDAELVALARLSRACVIAMERALRAQGFNIGVNLGTVAGAGIADHLHVHVVPRWAGDTNFMSVVAEARVVPEALQATWQRLSPVLEHVCRELELPLETKQGGEGA